MIANKQIVRNNKAIAEVAAQGESIYDLLKLLYISFCCCLLVGILKEGELLGQDFVAARMSEQLRNCTNDEEILACVARLYSAESFLYKLLNSTLRDKDMSKLDTLGPFCVLLWLRLRSNEDKRDQLLYRGMKLTDEMIWNSFTSTLKDRRIAQRFGNTLFIISAKDDMKWLSDMYSLLIKSNVMLTMENI